MRPEPLFPLFAPVTSLPGLGQRLGALVERVAGARVVDLLWHLPVGIVDRRYAPTLAEVEEGRIATLTVTVDGHQPGEGRRPHRVRCSDGTGSITLVFFHARREQMERAFPIGSTRLVSGRVERFGDDLQMPHPDRVGPPEEAGSIQTVEPVHALTAGLPPAVLRRSIAAAVQRAPSLPEWLDPAWKARQGWADWRVALAAAHAPTDEEGLQPGEPARARLAFDELLASQLALNLLRRRQRRVAGRPRTGDGHLRRLVLDALPYRLTGAQDRCVAEILADMATPTRMLRLLQGDVGSGKTIVALLAMLTAVEAGGQAALMAPTDLLARQHLARLAPLAAAAGLEVGFLSGRDKGKAREATLGRLADGSLRLVVGTHALFQDDVQFEALGLAVIDEQHRFGVHQRLMLARKGDAVDVLVTTATPIPRTLLLTAYGDIDVSRIDEKPPGRRPVATVALPAERLDEVVSAVDRAMATGAKVYWVCPLIEESDLVDMAAATLRAQQLEARFPGRVALIHGRMKGAERDAAMAGFADGATAILVATTVIEVGVDIPDATVMVIEHAEHFGLAQLHQLRGRIGRGSRPSTCILLHTPPLGETARARLRIMRETEDGFRIAEEDLRLRGGGEVLGTRQSGMPDFRLADPAAHADLMQAAHDDARMIVERDPELRGPRGEALRMLLYLFERDAAIRYVRSG
ncbi:ATP-dependent DNA helicase RecG [Allostella humosa]|uniref:ATP-dependent DNA helicase RecG n=1 Tax=Stella humosa TaxID=94 RepID=UPI000F4BE29E|nr:ATP-dependent DNA helicase RecG [Stella humosa]